MEAPRSTHIPYTETQRNFVIHESDRTIILREGDNVIKEQKVQYDPTKVDSHERIVEEAYTNTLRELDFFNNAFDGFVPPTTITIAKGRQGIDTVVTTQSYVQGEPLNKIRPSLRDEIMRPLWERCIEVYDAYGRFPDLHSPWKISLGPVHAEIPYPFLTENILLSPSGPVLVDLEDQLGVWSLASFKGKVRCPIIRRMISIGAHI